MKKVLLSVGSLVVVSSLVASAALATFLPVGRFSGLEFRTSDLSLLVDPDFTGPGDFRAEHHLPGVFGLHPGMDTFPDDFAVQNKSGQGQALKLTGKILPGNQDWDALKDIITLSVYSHRNGQSTPAYTLAEWSTTEKELPWSIINSNAIEGYQMRYDMLDTYPVDPDGPGPLQAGSPISNELMNKVIQNAVFIISGTPTEAL